MDTNVLQSQHQNSHAYIKTGDKNEMHQHTFQRTAKLSSNNVSIKLIIKHILRTTNLLKLLTIKHKILEVVYQFTCGYSNTPNYKVHTTIQKRNTHVATLLTTKCKHLYGKETYSTICS